MNSSYAPDVQRGSRISITEAGVVRLLTGTTGTGPFLLVGTKELVLSGHEQVFDLAIAGTRVATLVEGDAPGNLPYRTVSISTLSLVPLDLRTVTNDIVRVAITADAFFTATADAVYTDANEPGGRLVHQHPIDFAATSNQLAVVDERGVTFYDSRGNSQGSVRLFAPTAIAVDPIEPGWLVAIDGGVFHLDGPGGTPRLVASCAEPIRKVRRTRDATYVAVEHELRAIHDDRVDVLGHIDDNVWFWNDFDADADGIELFKELAS